MVCLFIGLLLLVKDSVVCLFIVVICFPLTGVFIVHLPVLSYTLMTVVNVPMCVHRNCQRAA